MNQQQLINSIEQQLDNLSFLDETLFERYCCDYYDENEDPIVELFTPELLREIEQQIDRLETV